MRFPTFFLAIFFLAPSASLAQDNVAAADDLFTRQVEPLLKGKCLGCHGDAPQLPRGLDMRSRVSLLKGGESGPALVPGNAAKSLLYQSVLRTGDVVMPPKEQSKLSPAEVAMLKSWIDAGAPWPTTNVAKEWKVDPHDAWAFL